MLGDPSGVLRLLSCRSVRERRRSSEAKRVRGFTSLWRGLLLSGGVAAPRNVRLPCRYVGERDRNYRTLASETLFVGGRQ
ncbi:hypothetical protein LOTGIDRAFT_202913, partial [Lottia gigantea]